MLRRRIALILAVLLLAGAAQGDQPSQPAARYAGLTLTEALLDLQARGLEILFTSQVVRSEMRVAAEPGRRRYMP